MKKDGFDSADKSATIYSALRQIHPDEISKRNKRLSCIDYLDESIEGKSSSTYAAPRTTRRRWQQELQTQFEAIR
ncbi:MAG: hypothetical protein Q4A11_05875 [Brachymonas sp.]|nr:hypothetical protein [Brachymonas sp.]